MLFFWVSGSLTAATPPVQPCYRLCYFNHYPEFAGSQPDFTSFITGPQPTENHLINTLLRAPLNISVPMPIYCIGPKNSNTNRANHQSVKCYGEKKKKNHTAIQTDETSEFMISNFSRGFNTAKQCISNYFFSWSPQSLFKINIQLHRAELIIVYSYHGILSIHYFWGRRINVMSLWQVKLNIDNETLLEYDSRFCYKQCTRVTRKLL